MTGRSLPWRTARLDILVFHLGLAPGGRPGARFAKRLMAPVSTDTLLRSIRRRGRPGFAPPRVVGIDDRAWRRNRRHGTIICDLERRRPIRLLPDREPATAHAWLIGQPQITTVARDRGGGYARVSTGDQDVVGQTMRLADAGSIRVFTDVMSGKSMDRPGLIDLLDFARAGDTLAVVRLDRPGRSLAELLATALRRAMGKKPGRQPRSTPTRQLPTPVDAHRQLDDHHHTHRRSS